MSKMVKRYVKNVMEKRTGLFGEEEGQIISPYRGPLSTYAEWHSLAIGVYHGVSEDKEVPRSVLNENSDVEKEPHMAKSGFVLGVLVKYAMVASVGAAIL